jgi:hypothetical protein
MEKFDEKKEELCMSNGEKNLVEDGTELYKFSISGTVKYTKSRILSAV